jgi:hypothetical protein
MKRVNVKVSGIVSLMIDDDETLKDVLTEAGEQVTFTTVVNIQKQYIYSICEYR